MRTKFPLNEFLGSAPSSLTPYREVADNIVVFSNSRLETEFKDIIHTNYSPVIKGKLIEMMNDKKLLYGYLEKTGFVGFFLKKFKSSTASYKNKNGIPSSTAGFYSPITNTISIVLNPKRVSLFGIVDSKVLLNVLNHELGHYISYNNIDSVWNIKKKELVDYYHQLIINLCDGEATVDKRKLEKLLYELYKLEITGYHKSNDQWINLAYNKWLALFVSGGVQTNFPYKKALYTLFFPYLYFILRTSYYPDKSYKPPPVTPGFINNSLRCFYAPYTSVFKMDVRSYTLCGQEALTITEPIAVTNGVKFDQRLLTLI